MDDSRLRQGEIEIASVEPELFFKLLRLHGRSEEAGGAIKSQYHDELLERDPAVGILGLKACGRLVAALSHADIPAKLHPGSMSARIDVVITEPQSRGLGIGGLLIAAFARRILDSHGDRLVHLSVLALHPAIARLVQGLGFSRLEGGETPLYYIKLDSETRAEFSTAVDRMLRSRMTALRTRCIQCQRLKIYPWCEDRKSGSSGG